MTNALTVVNDRESAAVQTAISVRGILESGLSDVGVDDIERRFEVLKAMHRQLIGVTSISQWKDFGGQPYMEGDAAMTIAAFCGITIDEPAFDFRDIGGGAWQCECKLRVSIGNRSVVDIGDCDFFDPFLDAPKANYENKLGMSKEQVRERLKVDGKKKAFANAVSRAVSALTGLRGLSWEDLEARGLQREKAGAVRHRTGSTSKTTKAATIKELLALPVGSKVGIRGIVVNVSERETKTGKKQSHWVVDGADKSRVAIMVWGNVPEWAKTGVMVSFSEVEVGEYLNDRQYTGRDPSLVDEPGGGAAPDSPNGGGE